VQYEISANFGELQTHDGFVTGAEHADPDGSMAERFAAPAHALHFLIYTKQKNRLSKKLHDSQNDRLRNPVVTEFASTASARSPSRYDFRRYSPRAGPATLAPS